MAEKETFLDKMLQKDNVTPIRRLVIGGLLALSSAFGILPVAITAVASIAINSVVMTHEKKIQEKKLLNFYQDEIGAVLGKSPESITIEDLKLAAAPVAEGGKGLHTLNKELEGLETQRKFRISHAAISSVITTGLLVGISLYSADFLETGITRLLGLGLMGFGYTAVAKSVQATSAAIFGSHDTDDMVNQRLMRIAEEIKRKPASPVEIFGLLVDANPDAQAQIKQNFKADFFDLTVIQKKQVVEAYEPQFRVIALTEAMNKGAIKPSLVGMIAAGDASDAMPGYQQYREMFSHPPEKMSDPSFDIAANNVTLSDYRKRILAERESLGIKSLH